MRIWLRERIVRQRERIVRQRLRIEEAIVIRIEENGTVVDNQGEPFRDSMAHHEDNWAIDHEHGPGIVKEVASKLQKSTFRLTCAVN